MAIGNVRNILYVWQGGSSQELQRSASLF